MRSRPRVVLALALTALAVAAAPPEPGTEAVVAWMKRTAHPFDTCTPRDDQHDLAFLKSIVGKAHIVALGEGTHGSSEFFTMKHRITRYLATNMGFTVFAIEANMPEAYRMNDYVLTGRGDPKALLDGMYFWTWNTHEVLDMVEWMRAYNASGNGRMQFTGFDMQTPDTAAAIARRSLVKVDSAAADSLLACVHAIARARSALGSTGFGTATGTLPATDFAGHHVRYSGWIRTKGVSMNGFAGMWMRADSGARRGIAFDNMQARRLNGTLDWQRQTIELDIPHETTNINFGCLMSGTGTAWFDGLTLEVDGRPWTGDGTLDLALDRAGGPAGFHSGGVGGIYEIAMDETTAQEGARSLRIQRTGESTDAGPPPSPVPAARRLLARVEGERAALVAASSPAEADWVIQNVRVVEQATRMTDPMTGSLVRDSSMADNVDWILAHERPGTKIVLWAHNGHVNRRPGWMGSHLAARHGADMVVIGFATHSGRYTAVGGEKSEVGNELIAPAGDTLEAVCHATGLPRFVLEVRRAEVDSATARYFRSFPVMRSIGALATRAQFSPTDVARDYDAIIFVDHTSPTRLNHATW